MQLTAKRIRSLAGLNRALAQGKHEFAISLSGGACFSKKEIYKGSNSYRVHNCIDESIIRLSSRELADPRSRTTNIGRAMKLGSFYCLTYSN